MDPKTPDREIIRRRKLERLLDVTSSTIYDWKDPKSPRYDPTFPKPIQLGANSVGWIASEIDEWLARRIEARRGNGR